ncbi:GatB/YqeY domain-containing protein [Marinilactibacillus sp. Marseille-P9653]|uniref:GatB/YqeY domain-containing protein n=1 Tax=Marinilactibacillus sp. Marseille-P9653 TaxID=2866583 RepID=UPI001CE461E0|nr:GatB/YqeY domain-containing protein [Marinilactibacillus sp. Marseille-P9653]
MAKLEELNQDMKVAMKAKDRESLTTIRMLKSALQNEQINKGEELTDDEELTVLAREKKQRLESLHEFQEADRKDLVEKLEKELSIVDRYLPEQLTEEEISQIVQDAVVQTGADSMKDMGKVMGAILPQVKGKADGSLVSSLVKKELSK